MIPYPLRARSKSAITGTLGRLAAVSRSPRAPHFACLCYHSISPVRSYLSLDPGSLKQQLELLRSWGYRFATVGEIVAMIRAGMWLSRPTVAITFDDGFRDHLFNALPILEAAGVRATFYITSGLAAGDASIISRFHEITRYPSEYLSASDIRRLYSAGMEIGAHTRTHPNLARLETAEAREELRVSREWLEDAIGATVDQVAIPFGKRGIHYTDRTLEVVREAGYRGAACVEFRSAPSLSGLDPFQIPRFFVTREDTAATLQGKMRGAMNWLGWFQAHSPAWLKSAISPEDDHV